jgi:hypothetical protein
MSLPGVGSAGRRTRRRARFAVIAAAALVLCIPLLAPASAGGDAPTRSVPLARARAAIMKTSPRGDRPTIGRCRRSREWTTCEVYERRTLSEEGGGSYPVTLDFTECVGERAHRLIFYTREVKLIVPAAASA